MGEVRITDEMVRKFEAELSEVLDGFDYVMPVDGAQRVLTAALSGMAEPDDEAYEIGKRDGYDEAVQHIDRLTGGDGEYRYCTDHDPERHTPDAPAMIQRIVDRFEVMNLLDEVHEAGLDIPEDASAMRAVVAESGELYRQSEFAPTLPASGLTEENRWQPIGMAPKTGETIIVRLANGEVFSASWHVYGSPGWHVATDIGFVNPTHWMPLPAPPALQTEGK